MADKKLNATPVPPYTMRHVDGVMHLTLHTTSDVAAAEQLRVQPPVDEVSEE